MSELFHIAYLNSLITVVADFGKIRQYLSKEDSSTFSEINRIKHCLSSKETVKYKWKFKFVRNGREHF